MDYYSEYIIKWISKPEVCAHYTHNYPLAHSLCILSKGKSQITDNHKRQTDEGKQNAIFYCILSDYLLFHTEEKNKI